MDYNEDNNEDLNYPLSSHTQNCHQRHAILSDQSDTIQDLKYGQRQEQHEQKKKSRGNRKLQRYRRKLRKQGMDSQTIAKLIDSSSDVTQSKTHEVTQQNEQPSKSTINETIFFPPKPIKKKTKKKKNKKNINETQACIKQKKNKSNKSVSLKEVKALVMINDSIDYASVPQSRAGQHFLLPHGSRPVVDTNLVPPVPVSYSYFSSLSRPPPVYF